MKRRFNTAGPCIAAMHYMIPPERRLPEAPGLVERARLLRRPRAPADGQDHGAPRPRPRPHGLGRGTRRCSSRARQGEAAGDDYGGGAARRRSASSASGRPRQLPVRAPAAAVRPRPTPGMLRAALAAWARACPRPLVLFFDEIDALQGKSLVARAPPAPRRLRRPAGRASPPPSSSAGCATCATTRPRAAATRAARHVEPVQHQARRRCALGDFTPRRGAGALRPAHRRDGAGLHRRRRSPRAFELTAGQPWLVNALAREIVEEMAVPPPRPITRRARGRGQGAAHPGARDPPRLARRQAAASRGCKRVIEPILAGEMPRGRDLRRRPPLRAATSAWSRRATRSASPTPSTAR